MGADFLLRGKVRLGEFRLRSNALVEQYGQVVQNSGIPASIKAQNLAAEIGQHLRDPILGAAGHFPVAPGQQIIQFEGSRVCELRYLLCHRLQILGVSVQHGPRRGAQPAVTWGPHDARPELEPLSAGQSEPVALACHPPFQRLHLFGQLVALLQIGKLGPERFPGANGRRLCQPALQRRRRRGVRRVRAQRLQRAEDIAAVDDHVNPLAKKLVDRGRDPLGNRGTARFFQQRLHLGQAAVYVVAKAGQMGFLGGLQRDEVLQTGRPFGFQKWPGYLLSNLSAQIGGWRVSLADILEENGYLLPGQSQAELSQPFFDPDSSHRFVPSLLLTSRQLGSAKRNRPPPARERHKLAGTNRCRT